MNKKKISNFLELFLNFGCSQCSLTHQTNYSVSMPITEMTPAISLFNSLRILAFKQKLQDVDKEIQAFRKKEMMHMEEIKNNVSNLTQITVNLGAALTELEVRVTAL